MTATLIDYPRRVTPMRVVQGQPVRMIDKILPGYDPMPRADWTIVESMRWLLGVAELQSARLPIALYRQRPATGQFALIIGRHCPIRDLTEERALDILAGAVEVLSCLSE